MSAPTTSPVASQELTPLQQSYFVIRKLKASLEALQQQSREPIAIVGASCRMPGGANDLNAYWRLLRDGVDAVKEVPADRWDLDAWYDPDPAAAGKSNTRCAGFLEQVDQFDPAFFGISPREAISLDPQQRLLLEVAWEALERAGQAPDRLVAERSGAFVGIGQMDYAQLLLAAADPTVLDVYAGTGNGFSFTAGRLSYILGLRGPNLAIDTACSSSLVAIHVACQSLRSRECDLALAGGVHLLLAPQPFVGLTKLGALSPDGRCKTFDASADGYGRGEGCGVLVLKRLSDAIAAGDAVSAVIRGSAVNHDGASSGLTVPNGLAQRELLRRALENAGVAPAEVGYVETHGTGTRLGDPIDIEALSDVFGRDRSPDSPLIVGSVKTNIGHLEAASGIAGLLKAMLSLQHGEIPPHLHFETPNPLVRWNQLPVTIATARTPWNGKAGRRIAGVSAFGMSGTNAHIVLEAPPDEAIRPSTIDRTRHLLPISARTPVALKALVERYDGWLAANPQAPFGDVCSTAATGRVHHANRLAIVAANADEAREQLAAVMAGRLEPQDGSGTPPRLAFLCSGQGSQYVGMGRVLYETQPAFRGTMDRCSELLRPYLDRPLLDVIYPAQVSESALHDTGYTQPALFALEYALAQLWISWGLEPAVMMGHSVGEYVAACLAGVFPLEDALKLLAHRARLMQALPRGGAMSVIFGDEQSVAAAIRPDRARVAIAAINGPNNTVISGDGEAIARISAKFEQLGIRSAPLKVSHAFHSPLMDPMLSEFAQVARTIRYAPPNRLLVSNLTGQPATSDIATPEYWVEHVRQPVRFGDGLMTVEDQGCNVFIEIGPHPALLAMARYTVQTSSALFLPSLHQGLEDWRQLLLSVAKIYERGARIDWTAFDRDYDRRRVILPTYPFQRQRYWIESNGHRQPPAISGAQAPAGHPLLGQRLRLPLSGDNRFETHVSTTSPAYLRDHKLFDTVVVPGASHIAMVLSAAKEVWRADHCVMEELFFPQVLVLEEQSRHTLQTVLTSDANGTTCSVTSLRNEAEAHDSDAWIVNFTARMPPRGRAPSAPAASIDLEALRARCTQEWPSSEFYATFKAAGYDLGTSFRWLAAIWQGEGEALARIEAPPLPDRLESYQVYPGLIDSCFQLLAACWRGTVAPTGDEILVPFTIERVRAYAQPADGPLWCHTRIRREQGQSGQGLVADTRLVDATGRVIVEIDGFEGRKASRKALLRSLQRDLDDALYELAWQAVPHETAAITDASDAPSPRTRWLLFADDDPAAARMAAAIAERGQDCVIVQAGARFERLDANRFSVREEVPGDFVELLRAIAPPSTIVHFWPGCASVLHLVRAIGVAGFSASPRLALVTRNAVAGGAERRTLNLLQAPLWGLGRTIALEHPELRCARIDLDPVPSTGADPHDTEAQALIAELTHDSLDDQILLRNNQRLVARLARWPKPAPATGSCKLTLGSFGILDDLHLAPVRRRKPGRGEIEVQVRATGLNLRDVLLALGMLNEYLATLGIHQAADVAFGFECTGEVTAVGDGVSRFAPGDAVMGLTLGAMNSHVIVDAALMVQKPADLSFEEAATIPLAFASAYLGLQRLARLQRGERVLIHAAAGGVGQAAVQLARHVGAEIFATASPPKWDYLKRQGLEHVFSSRTTEFAEKIHDLTGGRGVDCVLNCLTGEFIPKSLEALAPNGRFVELGRIGIWDDRRIAAVRPDVSYFTFDMAHIAFEDPAQIASMLEELAEMFQQKALVPIPQRLFPMERAADAFRVMAQAQHIGKVILSPARQTRPMMRPDASYIITGGLGALGLQTAEWMVDKGARHLVLTGRSGATPAAEEAIARMRQAGAATVAVVQADISQASDVDRVMNEARQQGTIRGIVHAAGVLDDGVLLNQEWARFRDVMAPKVEGARHLHAASETLPLDFFICYSSMASLLGSPGQGNYAAANAYLDALAHHRRALGLPALTINWGAWQGTGMAARADTRARERWADQGLGLIAAEHALDLLEPLWASEATQVAVQPVNWPKFMQQFPPGVHVPLLEAFEVAADSSAPEASAFLEQLAAVPLDERLTLLQDEVRSQIASVLRLASLDEIELRGRLFDLGIDSLMAVELKSRLERTLGCRMRPTLVFDYPTVEALASYFAQGPLEALFKADALSSSDDASAALESTLPGDGVRDGLDDGESEAEIAAQLARELSELEQERGR